MMTMPVVILMMIPFLVPLMNSPERPSADHPPFFGKGGRVKAFQVFGSTLERVLSELNSGLTITD